jgi:hypothetical protein
MEESDSISTIKIPLISSQPILAVSPNYILVNEYTRKRKQLVLFDNNLQRFSIHSPIKEVIIDTLWYDIEKKFLLLTPSKIYTCNPDTMIIDSIPDIKSSDEKPFKSFSRFNNQYSLLIAYDEWESKFIDRWNQNNEDGHWKLVEKYPIDLTSNEFIGTILAINQDDSSKLAITIYNNLMEQWRMELRHADTLICFKKILLSGANSIDDYRMIAMKNVTSDIKWLVYSPASKEIIAMDSKWKKIYLNYNFPVQRMTQYKENYLIVRTTKRIDIYWFI